MRYNGEKAHVSNLMPCLLMGGRRTYLRLNESLGAAYVINETTLEPVSFLYFNVLSRLQFFSKKQYHTSDTSAREDQVWRSTNGKMSAKDVAKWSLPATFSKVATNAASIEVVVDGVVQKIFFYVNPAWKTEIPKEVKDSLLYKIDRGSMVEQTRDFIDRSRVIIADMKYMRNLLKSSATNRFILKNKQRWSNAMLYNTVLINFMIIVTWVAPKDTAGIVPEYAWKAGGILSYVMLGLGCAHVLFTLLVAVSFFLANPPSFGNQKSAKPGSKSGDGVITEELTMQTGDEKKSVDANDILRYLQNKDLFGVDHRTRYSWFSGGSVYYLFLLAMSVLGVVFYGHTFCFHLLHIVAGNDILLRVIQAVTNQTRALVYVIALLLIIIYIYSIVAFALLRDSFDNTDGAFCNTMYECYISSIRMGLMQGGGMGDSLSYNQVFSFFEPGHVNLKFKHHSPFC